MSFGLKLRLQAMRAGNTARRVHGLTVSLRKLNERAVHRVAGEVVRARLTEAFDFSKHPQVVRTG